MDVKSQWPGAGVLADQVGRAAAPRLVRVADKSAHSPGVPERGQLAQVGHPGRYQGLCLMAGVLHQTLRIFNKLLGTAVARIVLLG